MSTNDKGWTRWAAWVPLPVVIGLMAFYLFYWKRAYDIGKSPDDLNLVVIVLTGMFVFALFGGLIAYHRPRNPIGWLFCGAAVALGIRGATSAYASWALAVPEQDLPGWLTVAWATNWTWPPAIGVLGTFLPLLFPTGRLSSPRWRIVAWLSGVVLAANVVGIMFAPGPLEDYPELMNPMAAPEPFGGLFSALAAAFYLFPLCVVLSFVSLILRARRAGEVERKQIKWIGYVGILFFVGVALVIFVPSLEKHWPPLIFGPLTAIPIAAAIAIYRYRLFDIDRLVSRTFSYAIVTAILGGIFVLVALLPTVIVGTADSPDWLIAVATLLVIALFRPVRRRVQGVVDQRFNRARYNAVHTIEKFTSHLRDEVDLDALGAELRSVVARTMQPTHVSLWVKEQP